ncbi:hypothetical protein F5B20DRAFT_535235 [Whalleya microplaca]|nr:hypothetical protein F5B20DRAFT_535235 [Whalleya microplaca]
MPVIPQDLPLRQLARREVSISVGVIIAIVAGALILSFLAARLFSMLYWKQSFCPCVRRVKGTA